MGGKGGRGDPPFCSRHGHCYARRGSPRQTSLLSARGTPLAATLAPPGPPAMTSLTLTPATELAARIRRRDVSPVELVDAHLDAMAARNDALNAYVLVLADTAREQAREAEVALGRSEPLGPLHGVPIAIKDLFDPMAGVPQTFGCKVFAEHVPEDTQIYVQRLIDAGAIVLGRTNTPEFGHKGVTDNLLFGPTSTPYRLGLNAGGSSGGSAAAVATGMAALAQGSDAGGSIRIPAAHCGVYGLKASFGRVAASYRPDGFLATPFVHAGPLARTVADAALMLDVMAGPHDADPFSVPGDGFDPVGAVGRDVRGLRVAYSPDLDTFPIDPDVRDVCDRALDAFSDAGMLVEPVHLGHGSDHRAMADLWHREMAVLYASVARNLQGVGIDLLGEHRADLPPDFVAVLERGAAMSAVDAKCDDVPRTVFHDALQGVLARYDVLVTPTLACKPFPNRDDGLTVGPTQVDGHDVEPLIGWCLTYPINWSGNPAASIPAGLTPDGLPVGLQIVGRRWADETVLAVSAAFERARPWAHTYAEL